MGFARTAIEGRVVTARASPTLELANNVAAARARGEEAWSLSTPSFPDFSAAFQPDPSWTKLTPAEGLPDLRAAAQSQFFGHWTLPDHRCLITAGAKAGLFSALRSTLAPGTRVIVPTPTWPSYSDLCDAAHLTPVFFPTSAETGFTLDLGKLEALIASENPGAILVSNPCNPTGRILPGDSLENLLHLCDKHAILLMLDQSFSNVVSDQTVWRNSRAPASGNLILFDSFSKNHLLQGARVAAAMIPERLAGDFVATHQTIVSAAPTPGQKMALAALSGENPPSLDRQRAMARDFITTMGWSHTPQEGTFYFFPRVPDIQAFEAFARQKNVYVLTGDAFGAGFEDHLRLCFGKSEDELAKVFDLLRKAS